MALVVFVSKDVYFYDLIIIFHWYATTEEILPHKTKLPIHVKTNVFQWETLSCPVAKVKVMVTFGTSVWKYIDT